MNVIATSIGSEVRPEAMADVPGVCDLPLTKAIVQYRDVHEVDMPGGRIQDIGLALVLDGRYASAVEVVDLGSASVKMLDLSSELVVLDWVYEPTLEYVGALLSARTTGEPEGEDMRQYCYQMALRVLGRVGFGPLTRATIMRIGFQDICRDLDLHEGTSVRIQLGPHRITRAHFDYDACALVFRTPSPSPDHELEAALMHAFPKQDVLRATPTDGLPDIAYHVRFPLPTSIGEARACLAAARRGLAELLARFEADRFEAVEQTLGTFGARETLAALDLRAPRVHMVSLSRVAPAGANLTVH